MTTSNIPPSRSPSPAAQRMRHGSKDRCAQARVTAFLRKSLAKAAQDVLKLEAMARTEGLLGERQRITHAKTFKRAKHSLRIKSVRAGFGPNGGWRWELPCDRDEASATPPITRLPVRAERRVPVGWVEGVARLNYYRPPTDVPRHRWDQFVSDCQRFMNSSENWAERAAELGWGARALFGCHRNYPLMHLGSAGLLWAVNGGKLVELHRDWAVIELPVNRSQRIFYRRDVAAGKVTLPWKRA
jgi:hypothetical protein